MTDPTFPDVPNDTRGRGDPKPDLAPIGTFPEDYYTGEVDIEDETYKGVVEDDELDLIKEDNGAGGGTRRFGGPTYSTDEHL